MIEGIIVCLALIFEATVLVRLIHAHRKLEKYQYEQAMEK